MEQTMKAEDLMVLLQQFTGTEYYYQHKAFGSAKLLLTDGTCFLREQANCYWLFDLICSYQYKLHNETFQCWKLKREKTDGWLITATDGNDKQLVTQKIPYSDFPIEEVMLFLADGVVMLPSEN
jgi:hypothetical protein